MFITYEVNLSLNKPFPYTLAKCDVRENSRAVVFVACLQPRNNRLLRVTDHSTYSVCAQLGKDL